MGLLSVYSYNKTITPHIAYRFKVTFFYNKGAEEIKSLTYYVKSVELPVWNINTENRKRFGNTQYVIPIFDFGQSTMKIVFLENDGMNVSYFLNGFLFNYAENTDLDMNLWNNCAPEIIKIKVDELDPSMRSTIVSNIYACHLKRLSTPHFSNLNYGTPVEVEAEFVIRYKLNCIETEIDALPREIEEPETLREDIIAGIEQERRNKQLIEANSKVAALAVKQRMLTNEELERIKKRRLQEIDSAKKIAAARRYTKLENARKDADKDGRIVDKKTGATIFVTAAEKTAYIKKKQAEANKQMKNIKEAQAYVYENYGIDLTKVKSMDELSMLMESKNLSYEDGKELGKIVRALNEEADKLKATKQELWKAQQSGIVELAADAATPQYMGNWDPNDKSFATKFDEANKDLADIEKRKELLHKAYLYGQSNMSMAEKDAYITDMFNQAAEIDKRLAERNGIDLGSGGGKAGTAGTGSYVPSGPINIGDLKTGTGYMAKDYTPNLKQINADAKNKGYDLSNPDDAAAYMYKYGTADKGLKQCTRGSNLTIQLMAYAKDEKEGKDMTGREYYKSGPAANLFDPTKSSNETIRTMYDKDSSYENMTMNRREFESAMSKNMTKAGDFVTFKIEYIGTDGQKKYSQHTVMANYDNAGNLLPYSDFRQKSLLGYSGTNHKITDIHFFSNKEQHS